MINYLKISMKTDDCSINNSQPFKLFMVANFVLGNHIWQLIVGSNIPNDVTESKKLRHGHTSISGTQKKVQ